MKKIVLAYSGGLDTTCAIPWLKERGFEVVCFSADLGSEFSPQDLKKRAIATGASKIYVKDLRKEFAEEYILPALKANAVYEGKYAMATALGRPLIGKYLVETAHQVGAQYVAHGCTGKGNDQVRIELAVKILDPRLKIIAPLREWELTSRESEVDYAKKLRLPIKATKEKIYSIDKNIWGVSIEAGILEDLRNSPKEDAFLLTRPLEKTPDKAQIVKIGFVKGRPISLNGKAMDLPAIIARLNVVGGKHCIGRTDCVENRTVGIKSREIYEAPAAWILLTAHKELERMVLDRDSLNFKEIIALQYSQMVYQGLWFSALKKSLDAFIAATQKNVTGSVALKLLKGNIILAGRESKYSLYKRELATYGAGDTFERTDAKGFINITAMPYIRG